MGRDSVVQIVLKGNESIHKKTVYARKPRFLQVGDNDSMDTVELLANMKPQEARVIIMMKRNIEYGTNICDLKADRWLETNTQKVQFSIGLSRLKKLGIVKDVAKKIYMINPDFIQPSSKNYSDCVEKWEGL